MNFVRSLAKHCDKPQRSQTLVSDDVGKADKVEGSNHSAARCYGIRRRLTASHALVARWPEQPRFHFRSGGWLNA